MFVRLKKTPLSQKTAVQLVENVRTGNKVKQKVIRHFGYAHNEEEIAALKNIALQFKLQLQEKIQPSLFETGSKMDVISEAANQADHPEHPLLVDLRDIEEEKRIKIGIHQVYGNLFDQIGFHKVIDKWHRKKASVRLLRDIILTRIDQPVSKKRSVQILSDKYGIVADINSVYRMMDYLDEKAIDKMQKTAYQNTKSLLGEKIDVIFYDCTTLYFESFREDELKSNGYSKDGKFNQAQVLLALMVTQSGLPVGYQVYAGSKFEGHTLNDALEHLSAKYTIAKVVFVADAGMLSKDNIDLLHNKQQDFIVGARIKNMDKDTTKAILAKENYVSLPQKNKEKNSLISYQRIPLSLQDDNTYTELIVTYSEKRARKDKHDRETAIENLKNKLEKNKSAKTMMSNHGYRKYLTVKGNSTIELNEEKIKQAEQWDGLHAVITNIKNADVQMILSQYKGLWQVEETFRISKHDMKMRPIFHWTPRRIKAHIAICFMALCCIRTLEYKVKLQYKKLSPEVIRYNISKLEASILKDKKTKKRYVLPSQATQYAKKIYQILGLKWREIPYLLK